MEDFSPEDQHDRHDSHIQPQSLLVMPNLQSFLRQNFKICFDRRVGFRWTIYLIAAWSTGTVGPREWLLGYSLVWVSLTQLQADSHVDENAMTLTWCACGSLEIGAPHCKLQSIL